MLRFNHQTVEQYGKLCFPEVTNPTIWRFIDVLEMEHDLTDWKIAQNPMKEPPPPRQKKLLD